MTVEMALLSLVQEFVRRQRLVLAIITELHPDFLIRCDPNASIDELIEAATRYAGVAQRGLWVHGEDRWEYFFHGGGCRLTHSLTGEIIDWDPPNALEFDPWKFNYWLRWVMGTEPSYLAEESRILRAWMSSDDEFERLVKESLNSLLMSGHLHAGKQGNLIWVERV